MSTSSSIESRTSRNSSSSTNCVALVAAEVQVLAGATRGVRLKGFDDQGEAFDLGDIVYRKINDEYKSQVAELHRLYCENNLESKGIVETIMRPDGDLEHRKLVTSYPYEWPANMYKDAVLFHLRLFEELDKAGLTLKDALPNNIAFDHTTPVFVDFLSLAPLERLREMRWLRAEGYADPRFAVVKRMLLRRMILPLLFMASRRYRIARDLLSIRSNRCGGKPPSWRELLVPLGRALRYLRCLAVATELLSVERSGRDKDAAAFRALISKLGRRVRALDVTPPRSGYSSDYDRKNEALLPADPAGFLPKQKTVFEILRARAPRSVLDIGANTGWYSILASRLGASVIALEEDEFCVDVLYDRAKMQGLHILPLKVSFGDLTREIRGESTDENAIYRAGVERLGADLVLVLGLAHHLVLGEGRSIDDVFEVLRKLAAKTLVLEFVSLDDEKIRDAPGFFPNLKKYSSSNYNLERMLESGRRHFATVDIRPSHPATRTILVFDK